MVAVASHQISLSIDLDEGMNFRCGKLLVQGGESRPDAREKLLSTWKTYKGQVFAPGLLWKFLRDLNARPTVKPCQIFLPSQDAESRLVNVQITLAKPPVF